VVVAGPSCIDPTPLRPERFPSLFPQEGRSGKGFVMRSLFWLRSVVGLLRRVPDRSSPWRSLSSLIVIAVEMAATWVHGMWAQLLVKLSG